MERRSGLLLVVALLAGPVTGNGAPPTTASLAVSVNGAGVVTSSPAGIACPSDCDEVFAKGTRITLTAAAATGQTFIGWAGACAGTGTTCSIKVSSPLTTVSASFTSSPAAAPAPVLQTGQTTCWAGNYASGQGTQINCGGTGQDGEIQSGIPFPAPRFVDNNDGTITDKASGLMWIKTMNCIGTRYPQLSPYDPASENSGRVLWQVGLDFVKGLNAGTYDCGAPPHGDWRMPNIRELFSLLDFSKPFPMPGSPFVDYTHMPMSSTTHLGEPGLAYWMQEYGMVERFLKNPDPAGQQGNERYLWIVRGP